MDLQQQFQIAQSKRNNSQFDQAIADYQQIRLSAMACGNGQLAGECLHMIGVAYYQQNEFVMAQDYYQQALEIFLRTSNKDFIAIVQRDLGLLAYKQQDLAQAKELLLRSVSSLKNSQLVSQYAMSQAKLGFVRASQGEVKEGVSLMQASIGLLESHDNNFFLASVFFDLARVYRAAGMMNDAKEASDRSLQILNSFSKEDEFIERRKKLEDLRQALLDTK